MTTASTTEQHREFSPKKLAFKKNRTRNILYRAAAVSVGLVALNGAPAQAGTLAGGSLFSIFLECNNDGTALEVGRNPLINGWQYSSDAIGDNTDGHFYDIAGIAVKETADEVVVVLSGNTPLEGTGFDRKGGQVVWGDLFFTSGGQTFEEATNSGNLFGVRFAGQNESGVSELGVYNNVVGQGVAVNNFGHRTLNDYINLIDSDPQHQVKSDTTNFLGDLEASDLAGNNAYFDPTTTNANVIGQGTKVGDDGFALLDLDDPLLAGFDLNNFNAAGDQVIAFTFSQEALQYQPSLPELAEDVGVDWTWDEQGIEPGEDGFNAIDQQIADAKGEIKRLQRRKINPLNKRNRLTRESVDGYAEVKALKDANNSRKKSQEKLDLAETILDILTPKKEAWDTATAGMTSAEKAAYVAANPEAEWTRKDQEDLDFQTAEAAKYQQKIDEIAAQYTEEELASANKTYKEFVQTQIRENPEIGTDYVDIENEVKQFKKEQNALKKTNQDLIAARETLEENVRVLLEAERSEQIAQRIQTAEEAAQEEAELERELGGPRTSASGGIPETEEQLRLALANGSEEPEAQSVPEPSGIAGFGMLGLAFLGGKLRRLRQRVSNNK